MKKFSPIIILLLAVSLTGCAWMKHKPAASKSAPVASKTIVTPDESLAAKVIKVNTVGRFAVLNFPEGQMPKTDRRLFLYRGGLKAAEVKITGPQQGTSIVADIVAGDTPRR